ncbi:C-GCAxxG-C-C family protein [Eubacterium ramulus]
MKSIEERVAEIKDKHTRGYNCAQIVLCSYAEELGIDEETLFRNSEGFGAGMGGMMQTCGAVTAMFMALGLANSSGDLQACDTKTQTMKKVRELAAEFEKKNGSIVCRELKGIDTGKVLRSCDGCIEDGIRILGEYLLDD